MRVVFIAGYQHDSYHRKVELLADAEDVELHHITVEGYGRRTGTYPSASGKRHYTVQTYPARSFGAPGDPHRTFLWPGHFDLHRIRPDIVQAESDLEVLGTAQVALARALLAPRSRLVLYTWQNLLRPRRRLVRWLAAFNLRAASHVLAASNEAVDVLRLQGYGGPTTVLPLWGLDRRLFYPRPMPELRASLGFGNDDVVLGYVGRLSPEKGLDVLMDAFARIEDAAAGADAPTANLRLLLVGSGPEEERLRGRAGQLGIADRVRFVPGVAYEQVPDHINTMDVLVLPSLTTPHWKEQFGRVLVEAMGCAKPVVGSDSGAIPEVIGDAGLVVREGDPVSLATALGQLAADADRRHELGQRGHRRALEQFTVERIAERTLTVWSGLLPFSDKPNGTGGRS